MASKQIKDKWINGPLGVLIRIAANDSDLETVRDLIETHPGQLSKKAMSGKIGKLIRNQVNTGDLAGAIDFLKTKVGTSVGRGALDGGIGVKMRTALNAGNLESAADILDNASRTFKKNELKGKPYGAQMRAACKSRRLSDAVAVLRTVPTGNRFKKKFVGGKWGKRLRSYLNIGDMDGAVQRLITDARKDIRKPLLHGSSGSLIRDQVKINNMESAHEILAGIVGTIRKSELKGSVGATIRNLLKMQDLDGAIAALEEGGRTWSRDQCKGQKLGDPIRDLHNQNEYEAAIEMVSGFMENIEEHKKKAEAKKAAKEATNAGATSGRGQYMGLEFLVSTQKRKLAAIRAGTESPEIMRKSPQHAAAAAMIGLGQDYMRTIPQVAIVMAVMDWAHDWPIIGDWLDDLDAWIEEQAGDLLGQGVEAAKEGLEKAAAAASRMF